MALQSAKCNLKALIQTYQGLGEGDSFCCEQQSRSVSLSAIELNTARFSLRSSRYNLFMSERLPWIAADPGSQRLLALAEKVAPAPTTLLITGESGSGKDHFARLVHELSPRRDAPFLKIDCTSLPPQLIESELFGHERGAFTGAVDRKLGRLELGGKGTIVLDEIAALSPEAQGKLLRVLQERTFERLGGTEMLRIEARLIALTNTDLNAAVAAGPIHNRGALQFSEPARRVLAAYSWPGNLRELRNAIERAVVFSTGGEILPEDLPDNIRAAAGGAALIAGLRSLENLEREAIAQTLEATRYHITKSAEILGISRKTLLEKRKKYGMQ